jgi:formate dehydrogenase iron-sulfur subunit
VAAVATGGHSQTADRGHHFEFETLHEKLMNPFNWLLLLLMLFCGVSMVARFALGLGGSTHLSDTYPWGLWIVFDLIWIAVAAGAFVMGLIYLSAKDLYGLGHRRAHGL